MENVLIISSNKNAGEVLSGFMRESFKCNTRSADTAKQAKNIFDSNAPCELALIYAPLSDSSGTELAEYIIENTAANCIFITKAENAEKIRERAERTGIIILGRPFNKSTLYQLAKTVDIAMHRSWKLYEETVRLERKLDEIRMIDKAKFMLMQYMKMTEEEAHAYLEQYAMNNRRKKVIAASEIIDKINEQYL
ncbi:MAG: ANTAR domain-containing protein [Ruminococcus sp.]|nr:ANTAR domain-containing protein [Ruminococcus sp.]